MASQKYVLMYVKGHAENNEAKVWQNGHETWKVNTHFDAPASEKMLSAV